MTSLSDVHTADIVEPAAGVFDHVMVDIETMSLSKHNALILSVGIDRAIVAVRC